MEKLRKNNFGAHYCDSIAEARKLVSGLVPENGIVGFGDSHTIFALELDEELEKKNGVAIPHTCAVNNYALENNSSWFKVLGSKQ